MEYDFFAEDGSKVTIGPIPAEGLDSGDKATNKALSAALKYALIQTFSVPTEDMAEADLESPEIGRRSSNSTQAIATSSVNNVDKLEEAVVESTPAASRGSFRKNAAKASTTSIPSGDL
jgi:hypothetical protein